MIFFRKKLNTDTVIGGPCSLLLLDVSGSMTATDLAPSRLDAAVNAALGYVDELSRARPDTAVSIISYSNYANLECGNVRIGSSTDRICRALYRLKAGGCTNIGDPLLLAADVLDRTRRAGQAQIVLLTDGQHNGRTYPVPVADKLKRRHRARIDCVGIGGNHSAVNELLLERIASPDEQGRPRYHFIKDSLRLVEHFRQLAGFLSRQ